jgi:hypothetical protein
MRKGFIYSLAALAAMPVVGNAADGTVITGVAEASKWTNGTVDGSTVYWTTKGSINLSVADKVAGNYTFTLTVANPNCDVKVTVPGKSAITIKKSASTTKSIEFGLAVKGDIAISIESLGSAKVIVSGTTLSFDASNFVKPIAGLKVLISNASDAIRKDNHDVANDLLALGDIAKEVKAIDDTKTYDDYVKYNLSDYTQSSVVTEIQKVTDQAAVEENDWFYKQATDNVAKVKTSYSDLKTAIDKNAKDQLVDDEYTRIGGLITTFETDALAAHGNNTSASFDYKLDGTRLTTISDAISKLSQKVSASYALYNGVVRAANLCDQYSAGVSSQLTRLQTNENDAYKTVLATIQTELDKLDKIVTDNKTNAKTDYDGGTLTEDKANNYIGALPTQLDYNKIVSSYITPNLALEDEYDANKKALNALNDALNALSISNNVDGTRTGVFNTQKTDITNNQYTPLRTAVVDANKANKTYKDYTGKVFVTESGKVETNINNLKGFADAESAFYNLDVESFQAAKTTVVGYNSDGYAGSTRWTTTETAIATKLSTYETAAETARSAGKAATYDFATNVTEVSGQITTYSKNAKDAYKCFTDAKAKSALYETAVNSISTKLADAKYAALLTADPAKYGKTGDTYQTLLANYKQALKDFNDKIAASIASGIIETPHFNLVKALGTVASLDNVSDDKLVATLTNIDTDLAKYNTQIQIDANVANRDGVVKNIADLFVEVDKKVATLSGVSATGASSVYGPEFIEKLQSDYTSKVESVTALKKTYNDNKAKSVDTQEELTAVMDVLNPLVTDVNNLKAALEVSVLYANKCQANKTAYDALYTNAVATLDKQLQDAKDFVATNYPDVKAYQTITDEWTAIEGLFPDIKKNTLASYNNLTLADDWTATLKTSYDAAVKRISDNKDAAKAAQKIVTDNKAAYGELSAEVDKAKTAIEQAKADCKTADPVAGVSYYSAEVLDKTYKGLLDGYVTEINNANTSLSCQGIKVAEMTKLESLITDKIQKVPDFAKANLDSYNDVVATDEAEIAKALSDIKAKIDGLEKAYEKTKANADLESLKANDVKFFTDNVYNNQYILGNMVAKREETRTAKTVLVAKINKVWTDQQANYSSSIYAENETRYNDYVAMYNSAVAAYTPVKNDYLAYSKLQAKAFQDAMPTFYESTGLKALVDNDKYLTDFTATKKNVDKTYLADQETVPGVKFASEKGDATNGIAESGYYLDADNTMKDLKAKKSAFDANMLTTANKIFTELDYETKISAAQSKVNAYPKLTAAQKSGAFKTLNDYVTTAKADLKKSDIVAFDNLLNGSLKSFESDLLSAENTIATTDINVQLTPANDLPAAAQTFIAALKVDKPADIQAKYDKDVKSLLTIAQNDFANEATRFANHDQIVTEITTFVAAHNAFVKLYTDNQTSDGTINSNYTDLQTTLNNNKKLVNQYYVAESYQSTIASLQSALTTASNTANGYYKNDGIIDATESNGISASKTSISTGVTKLLSDATIAEYSHLYTDIQNLKTDFAGLSATVKATNAAINTEISSIDADFGTVISSDLTTAPTAYIALEARIAKVRTQLAYLITPASAANVYSELQKKINELNAQKAELDTDIANSAYVKGIIGDGANSITDELNGVQTFIDTNKSNIVYYQDKANAQISSVSTDLTAQLTKARAAVAKENTSNGFAKTAQDAIDAALNNTVTPAFNLVNSDAYSYLSGIYTVGKTKLQDLNERFNLVTGAINDLQTSLTTNKNAASVDQAFVDAANLNLKNQKAAIATILDLAANYEIDGYVSDVNAQISKEQTDVYKKHTYTTGRQSEFNKAFEDIQKKVNDVLADKANWTDAKLTAQRAALAQAVNDLKNLDYKLLNFSYGDINQDGEVQLSDFNAMIDYILQKKDEPDAEKFKSLDLDENGHLDVTDAVAWLNFMLNASSNTTTQPANAYLSNVAEKLSLQTVSESNNVTRVAINLSNAKAYSAYQMDVKLPANMKLVGESLTSRANRHEIFTNEIDGATRVVVASIANNAFTGNDGAVLYLDIETVGNFDASQLEFSNIFFATTDAQETVMTLGGQTTGINSVQGAVDTLKAKIYSVGGKLMNQIKKGVNIIRNNDGSTQKVIKK